MGKMMIAKKIAFGLGKKILLSGTMVVVLLAESVIAVPKLSPIFKESFGKVLVVQRSVNSNSAEQVFEEAMKLYEQGTAESLKQAIPKLEEVAKFSKQAGDLSLEAISLFSLGVEFIVISKNNRRH